MIRRCRFLDTQIRVCRGLPNDAAQARDPSSVLSDSLVGRAPALRLRSCDSGG